MNRKSKVRSKRVDSNMKGVKGIKGNGQIIRIEKTPKVKSVRTKAEKVEKVVEVKKVDAEVKVPIKRVPRKVPDFKKFGQKSDSSTSTPRILHVSKRMLWRAVRGKCIECSGDNMAEAARCTVEDCTLWMYRMGKYVKAEKLRELMNKEGEE